MVKIIGYYRSVRRLSHTWLLRFAAAALLGILGLAWGHPATVVAATTLFVSPTGSDSNPCTSTLPCKTIGHTLSIAAPGDVIRLAVGSYLENLSITKNIVIKGASLGDTFISGGGAGRVVSVSPGATVTLSELNIQNGHLTAAQGAGIANGGTLTLKNVIVAFNTSTGGATFNDNGGGIWNAGNLTVVSSYIFGNQADNNGAGIYNQTGTLTVQNSVISRNIANLYGGGLENEAAATLTHTNVVNNASRYAGGGIADRSGPMTLSDVTISGNDGVVRAGGMFHSSANPAILTNVAFRSNGSPGFGGGLENFTGAVILTDVIFESNASDTQGGAIFQDGGTTTLTNATFSDNGAGANGGGLCNCGGLGGTVTLLNATFGGNWTAGGFGGAFANSGILNLKNTILANSPSGGNCYNTGSLIDRGHNLDSGIGCGFSPANHDLIGVDPLLGPLQFNGGYTDTLALLKGSPAINKGTNVGCPAKDQRGHPRITPTDPTCDIGAYEYP